jgi:hypothetical protein
MNDDAEKSIEQLKMELWRRLAQEAAVHIRKLEAANLKASLIKVDDELRIEQLGAAIDDLLQYVSRADWHYLKEETRTALEGKDDQRR